MRLFTFLSPRYSAHQPSTTWFHPQSFLYDSAPVSSPLHWSNLDNNTQTDVLYLDLSKAFDSVDHTILLEKLRGYGVTGPVQCWFADYLHGRTQRVAVDDVTSSWSPVTSGVPQGSILGLLLFVLFINDLLEHVENETDTFLYADDTKLHQTINPLHDCQSFQRSLTTCINLTDRCIKRTLYLSLVKSQLSYATEVWSPVKNIQLSRRVERFQRRATKWIMMNGELSYKERLLALDMLPLTLDREIKNLVFLYKALFDRLYKRGHHQLRLVCQPRPYKIKSVIQIPSPESTMQHKHFPIFLLQPHSQNLKHYM